MPRLLDRGASSRQAVIQALLDQPSITEDEVMEASGLSRSTVRNTLQGLLKVELATCKRRKRNDGQRGPGPLEYWLTTQKKDAEAIEGALREGVEGLAPGAEAEVHQVGSKTITVRVQEGAVLHVIVKAGTNDAVLTKDGRMLRVEDHALPKVLEHYRGVLKGTDLQAMPLEDYFRRFYPEYDGRKSPRPML